jgi:PAS domain S-box-containing protein
LPTPQLLTLEDLRVAPQAAWLWDTARARIVWANAKGVESFAGQSLFDLIDNPFDSAEPGVARIAELAQSLQRGEVQTAELHFPSLGKVQPLECNCLLHALADGRDGVLVVERAVVQAAAPSVFASAFAQLPMPAALISKQGEISNANLSASELFKATNLAQILSDDAKANDLLQRLENSSLVSSIENIAGKLGTREVRLTLRKLSAAEEPYAVIMLDDITERRALERQMQGIAAPKPALAEEDAQAFESLSRTLKEATKPAETVETPALPTPALKTFEAPFVPSTVRNSLEQTGAALLIVQNNEAVFATQKAVDILNYTAINDLLSDEKFVAKLAALKDRTTETEINNSPMLVTLATIPWVSGPAQQYQFSIIEKARSVAPKAQTVPHLVEVTAPLEPAPAEPTPALAPVIVQATNDDLKDILDVASDGIITLDQEGRILSFSAAAEAIFGYRNAEVLQKPFVDYLHQESRKAMRDYLKGLEGQGLATVFNDGREVQAEVKQGGTVPLFLSIGKLQNPNSKASYCAVVRDITSWKRTEKELRHAKDVAEEASRQKSDFLARISHELRTPLNAIIGFSEVMRLGQFGEIKNEKYRGYVNDIHSSGSHLLSLINDLLDLSKIESGNMELNFTAVNIADVTEHAMRLVQEQATRGRVLVRKSFPDNMPRVVADLRAMRQILLNVLVNAVKFTDPGGQVIISAQIIKSGELSLRIKDTGIGMNATQLRDALEPFKRVSTDGRDTQGTGLGLPLTKALVEANRAKFDLSSEAGQGTLIEIIFPTTRVLAE